MQTSGGDQPDAAIAVALALVRVEYLEMPGLQLTKEQAARLWSLDAALCDIVLNTLLEDRFLSRTKSASFVLAR